MFTALLRTNISLPKKGTLEDDVPLPQVGYPGMLVPWRVYLCFFSPGKTSPFWFQLPRTSYDLPGCARWHGTDSKNRRRLVGEENISVIPKSPQLQKFDLLFFGLNIQWCIMINYLFLVETRIEFRLPQYLARNQAGTTRVCRMVGFEGGLVWWNFLSWPHYYIIPVNSLVPPRSNLA